jgi:tripartite-type tricarboxylate transporter receptor subunit TctC
MTRSITLQRAGVLGVVLSLALAACGTQGTSSEASEEPDESTAAGESAAPGESEATAWEPEFVDGELQPLPDGFPSEPITLLNADDPSSADGIYVRLMQEIMNDGLSPVQINIVDRQSNQYGTWEALQFMEAEPGGQDGYWAVVVNAPASALDHLTVNVEELTGYTVEDLNMVGTTEEVPFLIYQRSDAPWGDTYEDMLAYALDNPGEVCYHSLDPGSTVDITFKYLMANEEETPEFEQVVGPGSVEVATAVAAGECDVAISNVDASFPHFQNGRIEPLLLTGENTINPWNDTPTMSERIDGPVALPGQIRGLAVPPSVPEEHREWLFALLSAAAEDERYQARAEGEPSRAVTTRDHESALQVALDTYEAAEPIVRDLGLHWDQQ